MNKKFNVNVRFAEDENKMVDDLVAVYGKDSFIPPTKSDIIRHAIKELYKEKVLDKNVVNK